MDNQHNTNNQPPAERTGKNSDTFQTLIPTKNKPALISYYLGVFGLIPVLGLPLTIAAIPIGLKGLKRFKANPTPGAKGHALAGLILGLVELAFYLSFILLMILD